MNNLINTKPIIREWFFPDGRRMLKHMNPSKIALAIKRGIK